MSNLQDAETGQRGYLLTGEESYREPFDSALREQQSIRQTLRQLTAGDPAQQAALDTVDRLVEAKFSELQKTMALRRQGMDAALAVVRTGEGKRIMDECRAVLRAMEEGDRLLLAKRTAAADAQDMRMRWVLELGSGSLLVLLVIAGAVIERDSRNRERRPPGRESERGASPPGSGCRQRRHLGMGPRDQRKRVVRGIVEIVSASSRTAAPRPTMPGAKSCIRTTVPTPKRSWRRQPAMEPS